MAMSYEQMQQVHHVVRLEVLAMAARAVASVEFDTSPEIHEVVVRVGRAEVGAAEHPIDLEFVGAGNVAIGGVSL